YAKENLQLLWEEYTRSLNPEEYPVDLSQKCWLRLFDVIKQSTSSNDRSFRFIYAKSFQISSAKMT
ncbi:MAG: hypothetical protein ACK42G_04185, partial [Candidatus Kapaibacteriota bacterium]